MVTIDGTTFALEYISAYDMHIVAIWLDGNFWDEREFLTEEHARNFMANPFAKEKAQYERQERAAIERDEMAERNASLIGCNRGRQVGPNKRGSM